MFVYEVMIHTPVWVWGVFVYVLIVGINALQQRTIWIPNLFILPFVVIGWKIWMFSYLSWWYFAMFFLGLLWGYSMVPRKIISITEKKYQVIFKGEYTTLLLLLAMFITKYAFGYLYAELPRLAAKYKFIEDMVSGCVGGFFLGQALYCIRKLQW